ncbi:MAG TPA: ABC transporter permease subunit [Verrucomicrobiae bacterium]|nr:ABC transporter permease subunit [Verrucomicrobiae bacterium]
MTKVWAIAGVVIREMSRRKDFYVLFIITVLLSLIMASVNFFNEEKIVRYLKELCLLLIWIVSLVISITTAARQIPAEREQRTLYPLLAKPVTRPQVLLGKFLGCWLAAGGTLICFYLFFGLLAMTREQAWPVLNYIQAGALHWMLLGVVIAFVLFGSLVFAAPSSNITISFILTVSILVVGRHLNKVALQLAEPMRTVTYAIYYVIPHLELFDVRDLIVHNWPLIPWNYWALALGYGSFFAALFLWLGCWAFQKKQMN